MKKSFYLGTGLFLTCFLLSLFPELLPDNLPPKAIAMLGVTLIISVFWLAETIPIAGTSIIPLFLLPLLGILPAEQVATAYGSDIVLLFMTGFFIATAIEKWNLHRRIALNIIKIVGTKPERLILGFMLGTAALSMWISNTATTLMMLPIAVATVEQTVKANPDIDVKKTMGTSLMLGIAYGANIGGIGTPIGTPTNLIFLAQLKAVFPDISAITFFQWIIVGMPAVFIFVILSWLYLTKVGSPIPEDFLLSGEAEIIELELEELGAFSAGEKYVAILFAATAFLWIFRADIAVGDFTIIGWSSYLGVRDFVSDSTVGALISVIMFLIAVKNDKGEDVHLLDWDSAVKIPWGILLLLGGALAISKGFFASGLSAFMADNLQFWLAKFPLFLTAIAICLVVNILTEFISNTALTSLMMPILAIAATAININPEVLMLPAAIAASFAFMLPVATGPNAIVYSENYFPISTMAKTGFAVNIIGLILLILTMNFIIFPLLL
ncbi:MAG: DASS family sodium-coupled anion symporter [Cyanobacteriota bacterium]|nr:DASS family sodium-coupled anion symporter [Cyanobacteriota bacterium]